VRSANRGELIKLDKKIQTIKVPFSPPDISEEDIEAVTSVLRSGWITTGPKNMEFAKALGDYCGVEDTMLLSSATAGLELALRLFGIGKDDEVITTPYTFAATANVILHTGAKPVFADVNDDFNINTSIIERLITKKTKCIISVDFGGFPCDYSQISSIIQNKIKLFKPSKNSLQQSHGKILHISDAAHSLGAIYRGKKIGSQADITVFSFHAVKNLTTAEGGGILFNKTLNDPKLWRKEAGLLSLHGQTKDAMAKFTSGNWQYDIVTAGYKYNMTDMQAALGLSQLKRYETMIARRREITEKYSAVFEKNDNVLSPQTKNSEKESSYHLYTPVFLDFTLDKRDQFIKKLASFGISANVHFIPLPLLSVYKKLGYKITDYPNALKLYTGEVSLPVFSKMSDEQLDYMLITLRHL